MRSRDALGGRNRLRCRGLRWRDENIIFFFPRIERAIADHDFTAYSALPAHLGFSIVLPVATFSDFGLPTHPSVAIVFAIALVSECPAFTSGFFVFVTETGHAV